MQNQLREYQHQCRAHAKEYDEMQEDWEAEDEHTQAETLAYLCNMVSLLHERHECLANVVAEHMHVFHNVPRESLAMSTHTSVG
jgi:hypothetical protein